MDNSSVEFVVFSNDLFKSISKVASIGGILPYHGEYLDGFYQKSIWHKKKKGLVMCVFMKDWSPKELDPAMSMGDPRLDKMFNHFVNSPLREVLISKETSQILSKGEKAFLIEASNQQKIKVKINGGTYDRLCFIDFKYIRELTKGEYMNEKSVLSFMKIVL